jgi:hypothetical protein
MAREQIRLELIGVLELRRLLQTLPQDLHRQAIGIVEGSARRAAASIRAAYPTGTPGRFYKGKPIQPGGLKRGVAVTRPRAVDRPLSVTSMVINRAPHALLFERGTETRQNQYGDHRGRMPPGNVFIPRILTNRRRMYTELAALVQSQGLSVERDVA